MPETVFSQKVTDLLVKSNLTIIRNRTLSGAVGLSRLFKIRGWGSVYKEDMQESIDDYKESVGIKDHCIFTVPHPTDDNRILIYLSELSEKELLQLISLRMFW